MELSPSWEAASHAAAQEITNILWNPKFHYSEPSIGPYNEPIQSSPYHPILSV
jgi:hypothetical protein